VDYSKAARELGYNPRPIRESLKDAYEFYRQQGWLEAQKEAA